MDSTLHEHARGAVSPAPAVTTAVTTSVPQRVELTVLMPCLDEAETVGTCVTKARRAMASLGVDGEVVVADNGSTDGSVALAEAAGARVVHVSERGYGAALLAGIASARGRFVLMGDADDSYDFGALGAFLERLRAGDDLVMGNRFAGGIEPGAMPALHRWLGNPVLSFLGRRFFRSGIRDFHCGLRGFRRDPVLALGLRTTGMEFASELVVKATLHGLRISEVPVTLHPDGRSRPPHLRSWRDGWRHLRFLLQCSPRWLFVYPGASLMVVGAVLMLWLMFGPRQIGPVGLNLQAMLYGAVAIMLGYQAVLFGVLSKVFAIEEGLLPPDAKMRWLLRHVHLETGLLGGGLLLGAGVVGVIVVVAHWSAAGFNGLDPSRELRWSIPAVLAVVLGVETILASFFFSLLGMRRSEHRAA